MDGDGYDDILVGAFFFDAANSESQVHTFVVNAIGTLYDGYARRDRENMLCQYKAQVFHDRGYWAAEFFVKADDLHGAKIAPDSIWGINLARVRIDVVDATETQVVRARVRKITGPSLAEGP